MLDYLAVFSFGVMVCWLVGRLRQWERLGSDLGLYARHLRDHRRPLHKLYCPYCDPASVAATVQFRGD